MFLFCSYDEGSIMVKVGREEPAVSMDVNGGKIVWAKHSEIQQANLKAIPDGTEIKDGERYFFKSNIKTPCLTQILTVVILKQN